MPAMPFPIAANTEKSPLPAAIIPITKKKNALAKMCKSTKGSVVEKNGICHMLKYYHQIYAKGRNKNGTL